MEQKHNIKTLQDLNTLSLKMLNDYQDHRIFIFKGDLGSGKTTMIQSLLAHMGSTDEVNSPTFSIVNEYVTPKHRIFHYDLYRIKDIEELQDIGFFENLDSEAYLLIEWPELVTDYLDLPYLEINIEIMENKSRNILILSC